MSPILYIEIGTFVLIIIFPILTIANELKRFNDREEKKEAKRE